VLDYLHTRIPPIIFRDLKPSNIIRQSQHAFMLVDFGIARSFKPAQARDTIPFGSPGYAAPEQYGRAQTDPRADIYSLGAILHQVLSGHDPTDHPLHFAPLAFTDPTLKRLENLIMTMVALPTDRRPETIREVARELCVIRHERQATDVRIWMPGPSMPPPQPTGMTLPQPISRTATPTAATTTAFGHPSTSFQLTGLVSHPGTFNLADLQAFPKVTVTINAHPIGAQSRLKGTEESGPGRVTASSIVSLTFL
jgi:serine/threonine protein kinase